MPAEPWKFDFLYTYFLSYYPPISISFSIEDYPILPKIECFYNKLLIIHPIFELSSFISDEKTKITIPNFAKKHLKGQAHIYTISMWNDPPVVTGLLPYTLLKHVNTGSSFLYFIYIDSKVLHFSRKKSCKRTFGPLLEKIMFRIR